MPTDPWGWVGFLIVVLTGGLLAVGWISGLGYWVWSERFWKKVDLAKEVAKGVEQMNQSRLARAKKMAAECERLGQHDDG